MKTETLSTLAEVTALLARLNDAAFELHTWISRQDRPNNEVANRLYVLHYSKYSEYYLPAEVGEALYKVWRKDKWGDLTGMRTANGIAKVLGVAKEVKEQAALLEEEKAANRLAGANSRVKRILDEAVTEINRGPKGSWTENTIVEYLRLALETASKE